MKATKEGDGTLLDHSMMVYGSGIADGSEHSHVNLPVIIAGKGNGRLKTGRNLKYAAGTPITTSGSRCSTVWTCIRSALATAPAGCRT